MTVEYGSLTVGDADRCAELEAAAVPRRRSVARRRASSASSSPSTTTTSPLALDGELVGYAGISRLGRKPPYEYEVHTIGVDKRFQGQGIGRVLLDRLLEIADGGTVFLEVQHRQRGGDRACTRASGFAVMGVRKRYYRVSGADAYTMRRPAEGDAK